MTQRREDVRSREGEKPEADTVPVQAWPKSVRIATLSGKPSPLLLCPSHGMQRAPYITLVGVQQAQIFNPTLMSVSHTTQHFENNSQKTQRNKIFFVCLF